MNARERFEQTRQYVHRLDAVKLAIMFECDDWQPPTNGRSSDTSDPTARAAIYRVDELSDKLDALRTEERELEDFIGVSLGVIEGVKIGLGERYGQVIEWRYIDCKTWTTIADDYGVSRSTGNNWLNVALDYVDSVGVARLLNGETEL